MSETIKPSRNYLVFFKKRKKCKFFFKKNIQLILMKFIFFLLIFLIFPLYKTQLYTGFHSLQPQPELINSTTSIFPKKIYHSETEIQEKEENDYIVYEITTPTLSSLYKIDDFQINFNENIIQLTAKVNFPILFHFLPL